MGSVERVRHKVTFTEMQQWPDDGRRYELYDGEVWEMPSPALRHQIAARHTTRLLEDYAERAGGLAVQSPFDIVFSEYDVLQPDVVFFVAERTSLLDLDAPTRYRPDLVVEVISPSTARNDRFRKLRMFARYEVPEYWIIDPVQHTVEMLTLNAELYAVAGYGGCEDSLTSRLLPDLTFPLARLFADC
jgi:Uma2 family endonuclease